MVLWQGLTEGGTAVPVQVTEAGRVVAEGQQGSEGPPGPEGPQGPQGPQGEYGPGDDVDFGSITAADDVTISDGNNTSASATGGVLIGKTGYVTAVRPDGSTSTVFNAYAGATPKITFTADGNATFADSITAAGTIQSAKTQGQSGTLFLGMGGPSQVFSVDESGNLKVGSDVRIDAQTGVSMTPAGSITAAGNAAGITSSGELYFTSRGTRYKIFVSQGLVQAEEYTREMELRERAEALRKPRTTDSVPED